MGDKKEVKIICPKCKAICSEKNYETHGTPTSVDVVATCPVCETIFGLHLDRLT